MESPQSEGDHITDSLTFLRTRADSCGAARRSDAPPETSGSGGATTTPRTTAASATEGAAARATARPPLAETSVETDREILVALCNAMGGPDWEFRRNWLTDAPIGEWQGILPYNDGRVSILDLSRNNSVSGEIPPELGNLANLKQLNLGGNWGVRGKIPPELGNLAKLETLNLSNNQLSGAGLTRDGQGDPGHPLIRLRWTKLGGQ